MKTTSEIMDLVGYHFAMAAEALDNYENDRDTTRVLLGESKTLLGNNPALEDVFITMADAGVSRSAGYLRKAKHHRRLGNRYLKKALSRKQYVYENTDEAEFFQDPNLIYPDENGEPIWPAKLFAAPPEVKEASYDERMLERLRQKLLSVDPIEVPQDNWPEPETTPEEDSDRLDEIIERNRDSYEKDQTAKEWDLSRNRVAIHEIDEAYENPEWQPRV